MRALLSHGRKKATMYIISGIYDLTLERLIDFFLSSLAM